MELCAFTSRLGLGQGRIKPSNALPASGEYAFLLGEDEPGRFFDLASGDYAEVVQDIVITGQKIIRIKLLLRVPEGLVSGYAWEAALIIDGSVVAKITCKTGRQRAITDLAVNVSKMTGVHQFGVRLILSGV